ncbi:MAG: HDOD domain-containing protein [Gemmatimonadetes bacterium]|nr:HDOD domain-containing protein [Gemmatimonadota bacterium]
MELLLVREPIFDAEGELFGYEIRHSVGLNGASSAGSDESASETELVHSLIDSHLKQVTGGKPAFVRATSSMLVEGLVQLLPRSRVVIQVPPTFADRADLLISCRQMFREGFRFAVDDFVAADNADRLLEIARYVRIDMSTDAVGDREKDLAMAGEARRPAIATGIETVERWEACRELGFKLFQGRFFKSSDRMSVQSAPAQSIHILRLLRLARDPGISNRELEDAIRVDPTLTFRLLKLVNSAAMGGRGIESIAHAIQLLGRIPLQRWLTVLLVATTRGPGGYDTELAMTALVRGRFLEILAQASRGELDDGLSFLVGMFSVMDSLVKLPMEEVVETAGLPRGVEEALLSRKGPFGTALGLAEAYEEGEWAIVSALTHELPIDDLDFSTTYSDAVSWSKGQLDA